MVGMANSPAHTPDLPADSLPVTGTKVRLLTLSDLDGRSVAAKSARALIQELENDLGGADRLSAGERVIVARAAVASAMCEHYEAAWLQGSNVDVTAYCTLTNALHRLLKTVGLERRPRDVTPELSKYIAAKAAAPAEGAP
jgi:hypothetical protein